MVGDGNEQAAEFAREHGLPGVAVSDAHTTLEVGVAYTVLDGDPSTPAGLLAALCRPRSSSPAGRRTSSGLVTPIAKVVQRARGNGRRAPAGGRRRCREPTSGADQATGVERRRSDERRSGDDRRPATSRRADAPARPPPAHRRRQRARRRPERRSGTTAASTTGRRQAIGSPPTQLSLGRRLRQPRTIISLVLPLFLLVLFAGALPGFHLDELPALILGANRLLLLAAFVVFYLGFPLRGLRWAILLRGTGYPAHASATRPRSSSSRGSSTASCRPSSATSTGRTC